MREQSLQSRLTAALQRLLTPDGMACEYDHVWKTHQMPTGEPMPAIRARGKKAPKKESSSFSGWLSPTKDDAGRVGDPEMAERWAAGEAVPFTHQRLRAQVLMSGWPTATCRDACGPGGEASRAALKDAGHMPSILCETALLAGWPSPTASLADEGVRSEQGAIIEAARNKGPDLGAVAALAGWQTPSVADEQPGRTYTRDGGDPERPRPTLLGEAMLAGWTTPTQRDAKDVGTLRPRVEGLPGAFGERLDQLGLPAQLVQASGTTSTSSPAATGRRDGSRPRMALNPEHSRWLMGFPASWQACASGWWSWALIQKLLAGSAVSPDDIARARSEGTATR